MVKRKYFGTDGVRGKVGDYPITPEFVLKLGWAAGRVLARQGTGRVLIGKDTRISGYMLESALEAGLSAAGLDSAFTGPMPTPAIAYLTRTFRAEAGIVVSASHNPYYDNGIKFFSTNGMKLDDTIEAQIEAEMEKSLVCVSSSSLGKAARINDAAGRYIEFCKSTFPTVLHLSGLKIVVDCANGATYHIAPNVLRELGADVIEIHCKPNGMNINEKCGATHLDSIIGKVLHEKADLGIAYDGDGDRIMMIDRFGQCIDGDKILYIIAREAQRIGKLNGGVVGTLMSNLGLELALAQHNIPFARSQVGDRYVLEKLQALGWNMGAENSGHVIVLDKTTTGDGIIAGLQVLAAMIRTGKGLDELCADISLFPQVMINVNYAATYDPFVDDNVATAVTEAEKRLANRGRVLLRKSGTEPLIRIMVEGEDAELVTQLAERIATITQEGNLV